MDEKMKKNKIVYKVVNKYSRKSAVVSNNIFSRKYSKGKIIKSEKNTLGLFCFKNLENAKNFCIMNMRDKTATIIKVRGIGKSSCPDFVSGSASLISLSGFYIDKMSVFTYKPLPNTICFQSVEVLT